MIPYARHSFGREEAAACARVLRGGALTQGPVVAAFEAAFASYCGVPYAAAVSNGTAALHLCCAAAGFGPGDEVIVPALTFAATANAALYTGARVVFADVDPRTGNVTEKTVAARLTPKTRGIIVVHYAGQPVDLAPLARLARRKKIVLIEDAAHAVGSEYKGGRIGDARLSDFCAFSFHPAKTITTGEGGMVTTRRADLIGRVRDLRSHGMVRDPRRWKGKHARPEAYYEIFETGFNYRLTDLQCAIGIEQLKKLPRFLAARRRLARRYTRVLSRGKHGVRPLAEVCGSSSWHLYAVTADSRASRDRCLAELHRRGIGAAVHYDALPEQPLYRRVAPGQTARVPHAMDLAGRLLSLPLYPDLSDAQADRVMDTLRDIAAGRPSRLLS